MLPALLAAAPMALQAASFIPGSAETRLRKAAKADLAATSGGAGGMAAGERQQRMAEAAGQAHATQEGLLAQAARGSAAGGGESGAMSQALGQIQKATTGAMNRATSDIRQEDLDLGMKRRMGALSAMRALSAARDQKVANLAQTAQTIPGNIAAGQQIQKQAIGLGQIKRLGDEMTFDQAASLFGSK